MTEETANQRLPGLLVVLDRLTELQRELLSLIREKIQQMRSGNTEGLRACTVREESLVKTIQEQEGLRRQLMEAIGRGYGINPQVARRMPTRQLAERIQGNLRAKFLGAVGRLRGVAGEVVELNRVAALIAQQVLHHLRCVFEAVSASGGRPDTYSPHGRALPSRNRQLFELTG